ncbi:hypothetical protein EV714DRAFT_170706, partial [Schizophyllum commune]
HPCAKDPSTVSHTQAELSELLNGVERHRKCQPGYCRVTRKIAGTEEREVVCRFDYPMAEAENAGVGLDSKSRPRFEPARNDPILNAYNAAMLLGWRAHI